MKTSSMNLDTVRGTVLVEYDGVQHEPNLLVLTDEEVRNLLDVNFTVGDVIEADSIKRLFFENCCVNYIKRWLSEGGEDVVIGGVTFVGDGLTEGLQVSQDLIRWLGSSEAVVLADGSMMAIDDLAELNSFSTQYISLTGSANDIMLGNNTSITIANLENRIVSDKNLVNTTVTNGLNSRLTSAESSIGTLNSLVSTINTTLSGLGATYVNATGDTMSGALKVKAGSNETTINTASIIVKNALNLTEIYPDSVYSNKFIVNGGTSSLFLKANGSLDNNTYLTSTDLNGYATQTWAGQNFLSKAGGTIMSPTTSTTPLTIQTSAGSGVSAYVNFADINGNTVGKLGADSGKPMFVNATDSYILATQTWVNEQGYLKSPVSGNVTINGNVISSAGSVSSEHDRTTIKPNSIVLYDSNNENSVTIECDDEHLSVYNEGSDQYGIVDCKGINVPNAASGSILYADGNNYTLYNSLEHTARILYDVRTTGFLNIRDLFGESGLFDDSTTAGFVEGDGILLIKDMLDGTFVPVNVYARTADATSHASTVGRYIPVSCGPGLSFDTYCFQFMDGINNVGSPTTTITLFTLSDVSSATNRLEWAKTKYSVALTAL